jgi:hypothetical protein
MDSCCPKPYKYSYVTCSKHKLAVDSPDGSSYISNWLTDFGRKPGFAWVPFNIMNMENNKGKSQLFWLYLISGVVIVGLLIWTSLRMLQETPVREASVEIPGEGWVTVRFSTSPFPPVAREPVQVSIIPLNTRGIMADLGAELPYSFGHQGSENPVMLGQATIDPMGMAYQAIVEFPVTGGYWLELDVSGSQKVVFQINVR